MSRNDSKLAADVQRPRRVGRRSRHRVKQGEIVAARQEHGADAARRRQANVNRLEAVVRFDRPRRAYGPLMEKGAVAKTVRDQGSRPATAMSPRSFSAVGAAALAISLDHADIRAPFNGGRSLAS